MRFIYSAILAAFLAGPAAAGVLKEESDRFTGTRSVQWNSLPGEAGGFALSTIAFYGKDAEKPALAIRLLTWSNKWQYLDCQHLNWLVDGEPAPYLKSEYIHDVADSVTIERFHIPVTKVTLERLATAKVIEFKACNTEGVVSEDDLNGLRQVVEKIQ